jgi:hypothetical protein
MNSGMSVTYKVYDNKIDRFVGIEFPEGERSVNRWYHPRTELKISIMYPKGVLYWRKYVAVTGKSSGSRFLL